MAVPQSYGLSRNTTGMELKRCTITKSRARHSEMGKLVGLVEVVKQVDGGFLLILEP